ncbi:MAG: lipid-A-disaccharide synthase [Flavobacteriales bacterium]|nr:lipid-A-disaccharide synthase [Flavobacteriales bacterium]
MKLYVIAGESSGDMHTASLISELKLLCPEIQLRGMGGNMMLEQGVSLTQHYSGFNVVGLVEVIKKLPTLLKVMQKIKDDILSWKPDAVLLTDYPAFNMRIARFSHQHRIPVYYYISPQVWAWKENRVKAIKKYVDQMMVILPFEQEFYQKHDIQVSYVGHPLIDVIDKYKKQTTPVLSYEKPVLAILPGSRRHEIATMLPVMLKAAADYAADFSIVVAGAPSLSESFYRPFLNLYPQVHWLNNKTYDLLKIAHSAIVTSGTATLETALFGVPQVVCYKGNRLSYIVAKQLVKIKYISLVNLILDKPCVEELIQNDMNVQRIKTSLAGILHARRAEISTDYQKLYESLGKSGASKTAAATLYKWMKD